MSNEPVDLDQPYYSGYGTMKGTLGELKESLDHFFDDYEMDTGHIAQMRSLIERGHLTSAHLTTDDDQYGACGCIIGLYWLAQGHKWHEIYGSGAPLLNESYDFESFIAGSRPGMTPTTHEHLAKLDAILALCEAEREEQAHGA